MLFARNGRGDSLTLEGRVLAPVQGIDETLRLTVTDGVISAVGGLADLSVYDRSEGRSLPVYWHGGRAWVEDRSGGGASFHVLLADLPDDV